jgi:hypothetical protein
MGWAFRKLSSTCCLEMPKKEIADTRPNVCIMIYDFFVEYLVFPGTMMD